MLASWILRVGKSRFLDLKLPLSKLQVPRTVKGNSIMPFQLKWKCAVSLCLGTPRMEIRLATIGLLHCDVSRAFS